MSSKVIKKIKKRDIQKIVVDRDLCIGAAPCVVVAPSAFELDSEGKAIVLKDWIKHTDDELLIAAQSCPVQAILLFDKLGKQIFP
ncbi:ferredoxin [bacterium]|nr:ferredoxin [bacterium]